MGQKKFQFINDTASKYNAILIFIEISFGLIEERILCYEMSHNKDYIQAQDVYWRIPCDQNKIK